MLKNLTLCILLISTSTIANADDFKLSFDWSGLKLCTSGNPNTVSNPQFVLTGLPDGTEYVQFRLIDKNVPSFNHGGGTVKIHANGKVPANAFKYKSPCPPSGSHTYEWIATAKDKKGWGAKRLGTAKASRRYPE
jgi:phosphatidylethanolamine-binding protein (PEBP) family uncharacterized protein